MNVKNYKITQFLLLIGTLGALSLVIPNQFFDFDLGFNIFALPIKNILAYFGIVFVAMTISYFLRKQVKELIADERHNQIARNASYYTLNILAAIFIIGLIALRLITASNAIPEYVLVAKLFSIISIFTGFLYIGIYYIISFKS